MMNVSRPVRRARAMQRSPGGRAGSRRRPRPVCRPSRRPPRLAGLAVVLPVILTGRPAWAQGPKNNMVEAVVEAFAQPNRRIYVAPGLELSPSMRQAGIWGRPRHTAETLERVKQRFGATVAYPEEVIRCTDRARPETCTIPGDGMIFYFTAPDQPLRDGVLHVRVTLYHNGRGEGGQILRETWDLVVRREPYTRWRVVEKKLAARASGPG